MQEDFSGTPVERKRLALKFMPGWPKALVALCLAGGCSIYVHENGIASAGIFLGLSLTMTSALWLITFMLDNWFHRPTNGTSGGIGALYIWAAARLLAMAIIIVCGLTGVASYAGMYLTMLFACGILDTVFIFTSL